jgi:hypothetical protein
MSVCVFPLDCFQTASFMFFIYNCVRGHQVCYTPGSHGCSGSSSKMNTSQLQDATRNSVEIASVPPSPTLTHCVSYKADVWVALVTGVRMGLDKMNTVSKPRGTTSPDFQEADQAVQAVFWGLRSQWKKLTILPKGTTQIRVNVLSSWICYYS